MSAIEAPGYQVVVGSERVQQQVLSDRQKSILERMDRTIEEVKSYLHYAPLICIKRTIGDNDSFQPRCTLYLSTQRADNIRQAYIWANTLQEYLPNASGPELYLVCIPEWQENERQVLILPEEDLTVILGSGLCGRSEDGVSENGNARCQKRGYAEPPCGIKASESAAE